MAAHQRQLSELTTTSADDDEFYDARGTETSEPVAVEPPKWAPTLSPLPSTPNSPWVSPEQPDEAKGEDGGGVAALLQRVSFDNALEAAAPPPVTPSTGGDFRTPVPHASMQSPLFGMAGEEDQSPPSSEGDPAGLVRDLDTGETYGVSGVPQEALDTFQNPLVPQDRRSYTWKRRQSARFPSASPSPSPSSSRDPAARKDGAKARPKSFAATSSFLQRLDRNEDYADMSSDDDDSLALSEATVPASVLKHTMEGAAELGRSFEDSGTPSAKSRSEADVRRPRDRHRTVQRRRSKSFDMGVGDDVRFPSPQRHDSQRDTVSTNEGQGGSFRLGLRRKMGGAGTATPPAQIAPGSVPVQRRRHGWSSTLAPLHRIESYPAHQKGKAIWTMEWSRNGQYLATGGEDGVIFLWKLSVTVQTKPQRRMSNMSTASEALSSGSTIAPQEERTGVAAVFPVLEESPCRTWGEHRRDVVQVTWSRSGFLLSASIDRTVRLWHPTQYHAIGVFEHPDMVTAVAWHPSRDKTFLTACFDHRLRTWEIRKKAPEFAGTKREENSSQERKQYRRTRARTVGGIVEEYVQTPDVPTACSFTPDGEYAVCGLFNGLVYFYRADTMRYFTQISCRNRRGRHKEGKKVTGLRFQPMDSQEPAAPTDGNERGHALGRRMGGLFRNPRSVTRNYLLLVSTNDNRVRLFDTGTFSQVAKFKGFMCEDMQLCANFSSDGEHVVSASEDGRVVVWDTLPGRAPPLPRSSSRDTAPDNASVASSSVGGSSSVDGASMWRSRLRRSSVGKKPTNDEYEYFRVEASAGGGSDAGDASLSQSSGSGTICTAATFAPLEAVSALEEQYGADFFDPVALPPQPEEHRGRGRAGQEDVMDSWDPLRARSTRVIVVGDYEGGLHVYARGVYSDGVQA